MIYQDTVASLKESKGRKITIDIEVESPYVAMAVLEILDKKNTSLIEGVLQVEVENKEEITVIIDALRSEKLEIYQVSIKNNLEELFLSLTEN
jgi:ABC-2 type transport system ATP-binding protein